MRKHLYNTKENREKVGHKDFISYHNRSTIKTQPHWFLTV